MTTGKVVALEGIWFRKRVSDPDMISGMISSSAETLEAILMRKALQTQLERRPTILVRSA